MAILIGDLLFAQVFGLVAENLSQKEASGLSQIVRTMIQSELLQFHHRYDTKLSVRQYRRIIAGKTAGLFALSAAIGGHMGNKSPEDIQNLRKGGYAFGMGFQIQDDYLDLWGSTKSLGKPTGQDWHQGQYGFPLILGFQKAGANILNAQDDFGRVGPKKALEELGVQRITQSEIERYFSLAQVQWGRVFSQSRIQLGQELLGRAIQRNH
jgi:geranylgeranyl pyrophosphate synthase